MKTKVFLYAALVPVIVFLFFIPAFFNGFVNWDDPHDILENPLIRDFSWQGIQTIFTAMWTGQWTRFIPLTMVLFAAEHHFFGTQPFGYHLVSVLLHAFNSLEVFALIYLLTSRAGAALVAALLFGLHPLQVEPVVWQAAGQYPAGAFFFLGSLILYVAGVQRPLERTTFEVLAFIAFFLALLFFSGLAMSLPFILLAIDHYFKEKISRGDVFRKAPFFILTFYFGWLTLQAAHHVTAGLLPSFLSQHLSVYQRLNLSSEALWMYGQKFFIPTPLSCLYPTRYYSHGPLLLYAVMGAVVFLFLWAFRQREGLRTGFLGLVWYLLTIAPFLHLYGATESIIYDRYFYIPSIGILLMLIGMGEAWRSAPRISLLWFIFIIPLSYQQIGLWRDGGTLWTNFIAQYPAYSDGYLNRSDYYLRIKEPRLALKDIDILLKLTPRNAAAYQNKEHALYQLRAWRAQIEACSKVIELNPNFVQIYVDRGAAYYMLGEDDLALKDFNQALRMDPGERGALVDRKTVIDQAQRKS